RYAAGGGGGRDASSDAGGGEVWVRDGGPGERVAQAPRAGGSHQLAGAGEHAAGVDERYRHGGRAEGGDGWGRRSQAAEAAGAGKGQRQLRPLPPWRRSSGSSPRLAGNNDR